MHKTAIAFAIRYHFRLARTARGTYYLVDSRARPIDTPGWGERTATGAIRMMRRHLRWGLTAARAGDPLSQQRLFADLSS